MIQTLSYNSKLLNLGQHIKIKKMHEETEYKSIIEDINNYYIKIALPSFQGSFMHPDPQDMYTITAHCETGIFIFDCRYISHFTDPVGMIKISIPKEVSKMQKRENVRINDFVQCTIQPKDSDEKFTGSTKNMSAGGMIIITHYKMNVGDEFTINFKLFVIDEYVKMNIKCIVVRIAEPAAETQKNFYGINFLDVEEKVSYHLIRYVFKRQAQQIKMMKEA